MIFLMQWTLDQNDERKIKVSGLEKERISGLAFNITMWELIQKTINFFISLNVIIALVSFKERTPGFTRFMESYFSKIWLLSKIAPAMT